MTVSSHNLSVIFIRTTSNWNATEADEEDDQREGNVSRATASPNVSTLSTPSEVGSVDLETEQENRVGNACSSSGGRGRGNRRQRNPDNSNQMDHRIVQLIMDLNEQRTESDVFMDHSHPRVTFCRSLFMLLSDLDAEREKQCMENMYTYVLACRVAQRSGMPTPPILVPSSTAPPGPAVYHSTYAPVTSCTAPPGPAVYHSTYAPVTSCTAPPGPAVYHSTYAPVTSCTAPPGPAVYHSTYAPVTSCTAPPGPAVYHSTYAPVTSCTAPPGPAVYHSTYAPVTSCTAPPGPAVYHSSYVPSPSSTAPPGSAMYHSLNVPGPSSIAPPGPAVYHPPNMTGPSSTAPSGPPRYHSTNVPSLSSSSPPTGQGSPSAYSYNVPGLSSYIQNVPPASMPPTPQHQRHQFDTTNPSKSPRLESRSDDPVYEEL
ncbi:uncharacterized protein LOC143975917 [Lithobates pipiens]